MDEAGLPNCHWPNSFIQAVTGNTSTEHLGIVGVHVLPLVWRCSRVKGLPAPVLFLPLTLVLVLGCVWLCMQGSVLD